MGKIIALINKKGGVGKTTTVINLAASLAILGKKILIVDTDPQANATTGLGVSRKCEMTLYGCLTGAAALQEIIMPTALEQLYLLPSHNNLIAAEREIMNYPHREVLLRKVLAPLKNEYDYILLDCSPSLGLINVNALTASDSVIIPVQCEYFALSGMTQLLNALKVTRNKWNPDLEIEGFLVTMYDANMRQSKQLHQVIRNHFGELVFTTVIRRNTRLAESQRYARPAIQYDTDSKGGQDYMDLARELLGKEI
jgi:chromosome partitioning protein